MTLGEELIAELARRGRRGMYFNFAGYQALRAVDSLEAMRQFLVDQPGLASVHPCWDVGQLADQLASAACLDPGLGLATWVKLDPCHGLISLPLCGLVQLTRWLKRRWRVAQKMP